MSKQLLKSTSIVSFMTAFSRILGFVRDMVVAHLFGAGVETDAFFVAFKLPNFMRRLFAEGAFSQAFVPIFAEYKSQYSHDVLKQFLSRVASHLALAVFIVTALGILFAPEVVMVFAPGFKPGSVRFELASHMLRLTFPYLFFVSLAACFGAVLNSFGRFAASSFAPVWLNVVMIACAYVLYKVFAYPIYSLAWGVLLAGIVQFLFLGWHLHKLDMAARPRLNFKDPGVRRILVLMGPALFGVSIAQINLFVDTFFASFLPVGSVSWLYFSERLMTFPTGVFAVAVGTVVLPHLSRKKAEKDHRAFSSSIDWGLRLLLFIGLPATMMLIFLSGPMLSTLFQHGVFNAKDVFMSRESLIAYSISVPFVMLIKVLSAGFYANQNIKTPVKVGVVAMLVNIVFNVLLILPLAHMGIAFATTIASITNTLILLILLVRKKTYVPSVGWSLFLVKLIVANVLMVVFFCLCSHRLALWVVASAVWRGWHLLFLMVVGSVIYLITLFLLKFNFKAVFSGNL